MNTLITGRVIRSDGKNAFVDIGRAEDILPQSEQIRGERYYPNTKLIFYLAEVDDSEGKYHIIVSRRHENLIRELFRREVPELSQGLVEVKKIVREAGERTKIAVYSKNAGSQSAVGQRGTYSNLCLTLGIGRSMLFNGMTTQTLITNAISPSKKWNCCE